MTNKSNKVLSKKKTKNSLFKREMVQDLAYFLNLLTSQAYGIVSFLTMLELADVEAAK
jgi:hypothetical protein